MSKNFAQAERKYRLQTKARGKRWFLWREVIGSLLFWLIIEPAVEAFGGHAHPFSVGFFFIWLVLLPIFVLGGYLTGSWRWNDFERKYLEDGLPPWE
jgi:hypothetical protein